MWLHSKPLIFTLAQQDRHSSEEPPWAVGLYFGVSREALLCLGVLRTLHPLFPLAEAAAAAAAAFPPSQQTPAVIFTPSLSQDIPQPHRKFTARLPKFLILSLMPSPGGICSQIPHSKRTVTVPSSWPQGHAPSCDMQRSICNFNLVKGWQQKSALKMEKDPLFQLAKDPQHL